MSAKAPPLLASLLERKCAGMPASVIGQSLLPSPYFETLLKDWKIGWSNLVLFRVPDEAESIGESLSRGRKLGSIWSIICLFDFAGGKVPGFRGTC